MITNHYIDYDIGNKVWFIHNSDHSIRWAIPDNMIAEIIDIKKRQCFNRDRLCGRSIYANKVYEYEDKIDKVIFNPPATIILWNDRTKTVVKCDKHDAFDPEKGFALAFMKKILGNEGNYFNLVKKYTGDYSPLSDILSKSKETRNVAPGINCEEAIKENFKKISEKLKERKDGLE